MNKKAQLKVQEMAFVLIAVMIFFALIALFYFSIRISSVQKNAQELFENNAKAITLALSRYPELVWSECSNCIDLDKAIVFKEMGNSSNYAKKWELDYLMIERVYPKSQSRECVLGTYPTCSSLTLINKTSSFGIVSYSFVNLCRYDSQSNQQICELGKIYASGKNVKAGKK